MKGLFGKVILSLILQFFQVVGALLLIVMLFFTPYHCSLNDCLHDYGISSLMVGLLAVLLPLVYYNSRKRAKE